MSSITPGLFRNSIAAISNGDRRSLTETTTTLIYGAVLSGFLYSAKSTPFAVAAIALGSYRFIDVAGTDCAMGALITVHTYESLIGAIRFARAGQTIPMKSILTIILSAGLAWYLFDKAGTVTPGLLRND